MSVFDVGSARDERFGVRIEAAFQGWDHEHLEAHKSRRRIHRRFDEPNRARSQAAFERYENAMKDNVARTTKKNWLAIRFCPWVADGD
jgi:hypothetical protein